MLWGIHLEVKFLGYRIFLCDLTRFVRMLSKGFFKCIQSHPQNKTVPFAEHLCKYSHCKTLIFANLGGVKLYVIMALICIPLWLGKFPFQYVNLPLICIFCSSCSVFLLKFLFNVINIIYILYILYTNPSSIMLLNTVFQVMIAFSPLQWYLVMNRSY